MNVWKFGIGTPYESQNFKMHDVIFGLLKKFQCVPYYQNKFNVKKLWWFEELDWEWKTLIDAHLNYDRWKIDV